MALAGMAAALSLVEPVSASANQHHLRPCAGRGVKTILATRAGTVFSLDGVTYACSRRTGRRYRLAGSRPCAGEGSELSGPVRIAGNRIGYGRVMCGIDFLPAEVIVRSLRTGRVIRREPAVTDDSGIEPSESIDAVVLRPGGDVGWIATSAHPAGEGPPVIEVNRASARGAVLLDSGASIAPGSLRLRGSLMTWRDASAVRSAPL
ncbi:MAG: hypothetical protein ACR2QA_07345 [Solirubrobacteraceae bacterium]